jgi:hypothetical protein
MTVKTECQSTRAKKGLQCNRFVTKKKEKDKSIHDATISILRGWGQARNPVKEI